MDVELLVVPDCPNQGPAEVLLRTALDDIGLRGVPFRTTVITTQEDADQRQFIGSPTILIDGHDPFAAPGIRPALACRVYRSVDGSGGTPALKDLRRALKRAAA